MDWQRTVSGVIAVGYLLAAGWGVRGRPPGEALFSVLLLAGLLCLPLAMIWFSEDGGGLGYGRFSQPEFKRTPPSVAVLCGWLLLLLPVIAAVVAYAFARLS